MMKAPLIPGTRPVGLLTYLLLYLLTVLTYLLTYLVLVLGTNIAVLLDCSKSSRQCSLPSLLTYLLTYLAPHTVSRPLLPRTVCSPAALPRCCRG